MLKPDFNHNYLIPYLKGRVFDDSTRLELSVVSSLTRESKRRDVGGQGESSCRQFFREAINHFFRILFVV